MSLLRSWIGRAFGLTDAAPWLQFYGGGNAAEKAVTADSMLQLPAVWACVRLNAEAAAALPVQVFQKDSMGGRAAITHPLSELLESPNENQTRFEFIVSVMAWLQTHGNAYAEIVRSGDRVVALNIIPADIVQVIDDEDGVRFRFTDRGRAVELPASEVLHIKGFGYGLLGLSPIRYGSQVLGSAIAANESAAKTFANGMMPSGILSTEGTLTADQRADLTVLLQRYSGSDKAGKTLTLEGGLKYQQLSLDPETTQLLETRRFSVEEICSFFGVPPILIGHAAQGQTMWGSGVEAIQLQHLHSLNFYLVRIESRIRKQLLTPQDRAAGVYVEFNREAAMQADSAAKASFLSTMVQNGLMSRNEARSKLNLPRDPSPEGDALTVQLNLTPLPQIGNPQK